MVSRYDMDPNRLKGEKDMIEQILALQRRVSELEVSRRAGNTSISEGALEVRDANGNIIVRVGLLPGGQYGVRIDDPNGLPVIRVGQLPDGKYGVRVDDSGGNPQIRMGQLVSGGYGLEAINPANNELVSLFTMAFGLQAQFSAGTTTQNTGGAYVEDPGGLAIRNVPIGSSRRALVFLSGLIGHALDNNAVKPGEMAVRVRKSLTPFTQTLAPNTTHSLKFEVGGNTPDVQVPTLPGDQKATAVTLLNGTTIFPDVTTYDFEVYYFTAAGLGNIDFQHRMIAVMPF